MTEHLGQGFFLIGRPEGDRAVGVAEVDDGVVRVLAHHVEPARLGAGGRHLLPHGHIQVLQEAGGALREGRFVSAERSRDATLCVCVCTYWFTE